MGYPIKFGNLRNCEIGGRNAMKFRGHPSQKGKALVKALELERTPKHFGNFCCAAVGFFSGCIFTIWVLIQ